ncbi:MAG: SIMPL domain-containing protein [Brevinema sp.]
MNRIWDSKHILALGILLGAIFSSVILGQSLLSFKKLDRSVVVKGLSEREYEADVVIWPVGFSDISNDLTALYDSLERKKNSITGFLREGGIVDEDITLAPPQITDRQALSYNEGAGTFRYIARRYITVRTTNIALIRKIMTGLPELGKQGIVFLENKYDNPIQYLFTKLNEIKPEMIEESTKEARIVALKFAKDSQSKLGKIKNASQGQFTINDRDINNPHLKVIRVVSTVEYYLSD